MKIRRILGFCCLLALLCVGAVQAADKDKGFMVGPRENIVLLGDSITADGHYGQFIQNAIDARYPERQIRVLSRGSHGDTARGSLQRLEMDVVQWRPAWVLINFGINDVNSYSPAEFLQIYEALINRISRDTSAKIGIVSPIYQDTDEESPKLREMVAGLAALAKRYDAVYMPVYETTKRLRPTIPAGIAYAPDGTHPNDIGYQIFAQIILQALKFPLDKKPIDLAISTLRVTSNVDKNLAGQNFVLALPQPVRVQITNPFVPEGVAKLAANPIQLDGKLDEWDKSAPMFLGRPNQMVWGVMSWPRDHFGANTYATYDNEAFYFGIDVQDPVVRGGANPRFVVARDCVEVCLDLRSEADRKENPQFTYVGQRQVSQLIAAPATNEVPQAMLYIGNGDATFIAGATIASSVTSLGYQLELRLPKKNFTGAQLAAGTQVGFDFAVVNVDRDDNYLEATSLRWSGSTASSFSTREFGTLILE